MRIHQFNIRYENGQDRLLARINTDTGREVRLWLTRRLTLGLLPLLRRLVGEHDERVAEAHAGPTPARDPLARQLLGEFRKDQALQQADFKTPFKEPVPDSKDPGVPLLIDSVAVNVLASGNLQVVFRGLPAGAQRREIKLELDGQLMHGFIHLLELAFTASQWSLAPVAALESAANPANPARIARPQYLN
jgi:hypothetical protein